MFGEDRRPRERPRVVVWFRRYAYARLAIDVFLAGLGVVGMAWSQTLGRGDWEHDADYYFSFGLVLFVGGVAFGLADLATVRLAPDPHLWVLSLVLICVGLLHPCCMPASIPLLIGWIKPEIQRYYGRS